MSRFNTKGLLALIEVGEVKVFKEDSYLGITFGDTTGNILLALDPAFCVGYWLPGLIDKKAGNLKLRVSWWNKQRILWALRSGAGVNTVSDVIGKRVEELAEQRAKKAEDELKKTLKQLQVVEALSQARRSEQETHSM